FLAAPARAQSTPEAEAEVRAVFDKLFDGMWRGDSTAVRAAFHPTATLRSMMVREGTPMMRADSVDAFVRAVGTPHTQTWDERVPSIQVHVDGPMATVWMPYTFYLDGRLSHCGVNTAQLFRGTQGWKIIHLSDTRKREGCPEVPSTRSR
ncbi:MAG TPA: nuclear transport factor 2 family protein, partial [Longimicrobium sp.]|nr:nuclear transport factor 2 family protein [Longimicrobium sp.]